MLSSIDLIIECRDYRVPLTSRNPLFEQSLAGRERVIVYTKRDLGSHGLAVDKKRETQHGLAHDSLTGSRILIVGMPNVGKSSLLNALRMAGVNRGKAAFTGAQPGITRKIASGVKIVDPDPETGTEGVYLVDTPGVFVPFVPDTESMLKLALVGSVKDTIIAPTTLADYLLFHMNLKVGGRVYGEYCGATNDVVEFLEGVCRKTGRLGKGGVPDLEAAALWVVQRWRQGNLGRFVLDEVEVDGLERKVAEEVRMSVSQARKQAKDVQRMRAKTKKSDSMG
ncbi:hypothetical protein EYC80_000569 [Monilinia laxa]|nr:hypothetical protein EYC80_000569 [Monilinia laxa]